MQQFSRKGAKGAYAVMDIRSNINLLKLYQYDKGCVPLQCGGISC